MTDKTLGLYVHVPFCRSKCLYCDFYSGTDDSRKSAYADALARHFADYGKNLGSYEVDTVFFGGGTPTALPVSMLNDIIDSMYSRFNIREDAEFTVEANPATVSLSDLKRLRRAGVNRLSLGLQSAQNNELGALGRIHTFEDFCETFRLARKAGFRNISVDLMYGIPDQTKASLADTLKKVCALEPEHISLYNLIIEEGTPFYAGKDKLKLPGEDLEWVMYVDSIRYLAEQGYFQYEISNFSRPGRQCLHNLRYWNCEEYLGFGPSAHSYFGGRRFAYKRSLEDYIRSVLGQEDIPDLLSESYTVKPAERLGEYVMLRLRLNEGVDTDTFAARFGVSFEKMFEKHLALYCKNGFMEKKGRRYAFTTKGMYVSNYILSSMLDFDSDILTGVANGTDK